MALCHARIHPLGAGMERFLPLSHENIKTRCFLQRLPGISRSSPAPCSPVPAPEALSGALDLVELFLTGTRPIGRSNSIPGNVS